MSKSAKNGHFWVFSTFSLFLTKIAKFFFSAYFGLNLIFQKTKFWNRSKFREGVKWFSGQKCKNDDFGPFFVISPSASSVKLEIGRSKNHVFSKKKRFLGGVLRPLFSRKIDFWEKVILTPCFERGWRKFKKWFLRYQTGALQSGFPKSGNLTCLHPKLHFSNSFENLFWTHFWVQNHKKNHVFWPFWTSKTPFF